jgi:putative transposase
MPYKYRKLSSEERQALLRIRRKRGYPLHAPPHPYRDAGYYLITAANFEHVPIMALPERRTEFEILLLSEMKEINADAVCWVILPNHYHVLVGIESLDSVSVALKHLHGVTSREWNLIDGLTGKRRVWYKFTDQMMRNEKHLHQAFNYVHYNPVKHGFVTDVYEWPWSSLPLYFEDQGRGWLRARWESMPPPPDFGKGWDE